MKTAFFIVLALSVFELSTQKPHGHHGHGGNQQEPHDQKDFDYLALRQIWPKTSCLFAKGHQCTIDNNVNGWVVHGLWPDYLQGYPSFCDKSMKFDPSKIQDLISNLEQYWPNLFSDTSLTSFWQHEWEKHGTCALSLEQVKDEHDYFEVTLGLHDKYDFGNILSKNGIVPSDSKGYTLEEITDAIEGELKIKPLITCENQGKKNFIAEMQICLDKNLEVMECVHATDGGKCNNGAPIYYPIIH